VGHEFSRATLAATLIALAAACGGGDDSGEPPPVLDNARQQVSAATPADEAADAEPSPGSANEADGETGVDSAPAELPAPDPSTFEGANRVVNLWVGESGTTAAIDVWGRRTFTNGPILLAEGIEFGRASDYFAAPAGYSLVVVGSGAGPDGEELASMFNAADGEQITLVYTNGDSAGAVEAPNLYEYGNDQAPRPAAPGSGLVVLFAPNIRAFSDEMIASVGGDAFYVGDGSAVCRTQRIEADGFSPSILGGTQRVELELPPGPAAISLYPWFSSDECNQPSAHDLTVDVAPDRTVMVFVYTRDGASVESMILPVSPVS
jgi:hypothetical protein